MLWGLPLTPCDTTPRIMIMDEQQLIDEIAATLFSLGNVFKNAGYDTYYGGKIHLPGDSRGIHGKDEEAQSWITDRW